MQPAPLQRGTLEPTAGERRLAPGCRIDMFTQHHVDQLDLAANACDYLLLRARAADPATLITPKDVRRRIGRFGLTGHLQTQRMGLLSGGQRSRVAMALVSYKRCAPTAL